VQHSIPHGDVVTVIPGIFNLIHTENSGIAFSLFSGESAPWKLVLLIGVSLALLVTVVVVALKSRQMNWQTGVGLALIVGGGIIQSARPDSLRRGGRLPGCLLPELSLAHL